MTDARNRMDDAERLMKEPLLVQALADLEKRALDRLLSEPPTDCPDPDRHRRECIDTVNALRAIPQAIRVAMLTAEAEIKRRGGSVA